MSYSKQNEAFLKDKLSFFSKNSSIEYDSNGKKRDANGLIFMAGHYADPEHYRDYNFTLENQITLEAEFTQLFNVLKKQKDDDNQMFWVYCYYCATLLENFYKAYGQKANEEKYIELKKKIKARIETGKLPADAQTRTSFTQHLYDSFLEGFRNIMKIPYHVSSLRDYVAYSNLCRLYWVFNRLTITRGLALAKELQFIEKLDAFLGTHTNVDQIISTMQAPNGFLNYLSVGFFLVNFIIDAGLLVRHTFFPTEAEEKGNTSAYDRFKYELYKRHTGFINNGVWATVNFICNFNDVVGISGSAAGAITAVFLGFDVCQSLYAAYLAEREYQIKREQYESQIDFYAKEPVSAERNRHIEILKAQIKELEMDVQLKTTSSYFGASAAVLLMSGFSTTLIFSPAWVTVVGFLACHIAIAMYMSKGAYSAYQQKSIRLEQDTTLKGQELDVATKELEIARNAFVYAMTKNTIAPIVLITTVAICWPAAVALTVLYVGTELLHSNEQHSAKEEVKRLAAGEPKDAMEEGIDESRRCGAGIVRGTI